MSNEDSVENWCVLVVARLLGRTETKPAFLPPFSPVLMELVLCKRELEQRMNALLHLLGQHSHMTPRC